MAMVRDRSKHVKFGSKELNRMRIELEVMKKSLTAVIGRIGWILCDQQPLSKIPYAIFASNVSVWMECASAVTDASSCPPARSIWNDAVEF
jgi:hypothetical protein